ncbi:CpsD/CapB family tyrosine-protein kinase [Lacicoccus alkaliphilus]|uniref:non-specific protein-tyrosine kinase n=1 Tax=Lacicoccus alkaliphilus DSM 16010 TaxID=1123231 RepID=A0A1M7CU82_9BACL|nr:CpsD/CapB family tyrosine-protein kinase [Salinicoccus alkaliphilus]SHL70794.1 capsular exopolysaccharide family [Salinicoccus alkaliphilus DSM 16010]
MEMNRGHRDEGTRPRYLVVDKQPHATVSEQFRTIRTNIMYSSVNRDIRSVLFTSDMASAGKSTVAANMAVAYAQAGKKTLLLDADLRRPTSHETFRVDNRTGLSTLIVNDIPLEEVIKATEFERLDLITSGPIPPNPAELLSAPKLDSIMLRLMTHYDMVIIDSPPVLSVTDGQLLSKNANGVIMVTNVENNNRERLNEAKDLLNKAGANIIGIVLNGRSPEYKKDNQYHYYQEPRAT